MRQTAMSRCYLTVILLFLSSVRAFPAELELRYAAIERVIADQLFSQEGRLYVRGNKATSVSSPIWSRHTSAPWTDACG